VILLENNTLSTLTVALEEVILAGNNTLLTLFVVLEEVTLVETQTGLISAAGAPNDHSPG
jgi:hypothetical protein